MQVNITEDGRIEGYLGVEEWAKKNGFESNLVRSWIFRKKIEFIHIKSGETTGMNFIKEDYMYDPKEHDARKNSKRRPRKPRYKIDGYISIPEYCEKHGVSRQCVHEKCKKGILPAITVSTYDGKRWFIREDELQEV